MIVTLKNADFSESNIDILTTWSILKILGSGATSSNTATYVDKNASYSTTITIEEGYEIDSAGVTITMGGANVDYALNDDGTTIDISISVVTGNIVVKVPTKNVNSGGSIVPIQSDYAENDEQSDAHILNRPCYVESEAIDIPFSNALGSVLLWDEVYIGADFMTAYRVSELTPTEDALIGATIYAFDYYASDREHIIQANDLVIDGDGKGLYCEYSSAYVFVVYESGYQPSLNTAMGNSYSPIFTDTGMYFTVQSGYDGAKTERLVIQEKIKTLDNKYLDLSNNDDLKDELSKKQDLMVNTDAYDAVPVILRNSSDISYITATNGLGGGTIVRREPNGQLRTQPAIEDYHATPLSQVNSLLSDISQAVIEGFNISAGSTLEDAIGQDEYGLFMITGENVSLTYSSSESTNGSGVSSKYHFVIKSKVKNIYDNGETNRMFHMYEGNKVLTITLPTSKDITLTSGVSVTNGSSQYGCRIFKMSMKSV